MAIPLGGDWEGRLPSNAFSFELVATPERPEQVVEKDGVRFEILVPGREWVIPSKDPGSRTPVNLGLRVTNKTEKAVRFSRFDTLYPRMTGPDGKALRLDGGRNGTLGRVEADCPLVAPGESVTFIVDAALSWRRGQLELGGADGFGGVWLFHSLAPGAYKVRILYHNDRAESGFGPEQKTVRDVWTGEVETPEVSVAIVQAPAGKD